MAEQARGPSRWKVGLGIALVAAAAVVIASGPRRILGPLIEELFDNVERLERIGKLQLRGSAGWFDVPEEAHRRTTWTTEDAFAFEHTAWQSLSPGFQLGALEVRRAPNPQVVSLLLVRMDPRAWRFQVLAGDGWPQLQVEQLARAADAPFAINGPFFSDEGPLGVVIMDGQTKSRQVRHKASHFLVDGPGRAPRIVHESGADLGGAVEGFQGFPAIMQDGEVYSYMRWGGRGFDIWTVDRRTAACIDREGLVLFLATDTLTNGLSLNELATLLAALGCVDAMGFDGGSSTSLFLDLGGIRRRIPSIGGIPVALGAWPLFP